MTAEDFEDFPDFTVGEVAATGANPADVHRRTIECTQRLRIGVGRPVHIHRNGLTSGKHSSKRHPRGEAVDFYLDPRDGEVNPRAVIFEMVLAGFRGVGVYKNKDGTWSFHGDTRSKWGDWFRDRSGAHVVDKSIFCEEISQWK